MKQGRARVPKGASDPGRVAVGQLVDSHSGTTDRDRRGEMWTLKSFIEYLDQLSAVEDGLQESVRIQNVEKEDRSNDERLTENDALALIDFFRNDENARATREHALLEIAWHTDAQTGSIRALDQRDAQLDENYLEFKHRPDTDTGLKNKRDGERSVAVPSEVSDVIEEYI